MCDQFCFLFSEHSAASFEMQDFFVAYVFSIKIESIPMKFLHDECEISAFQRNAGVNEVIDYLCSELDTSLSA